MANIYWSTPKINWAPLDVATIEDINRWESNILAVWNQASPTEVTTGTGSAYILTVDDITLLQEGTAVTAIIHAESLNNPTLNLNSLGVLPLKKQDGSSVLVGDFPIGAAIPLVQVNSAWQATIPVQDFVTVDFGLYGVDVGAANAYVATLGGVPSYSSGLTFGIKIANDNTGASTININSLGVKNIKNLDGEDVRSKHLVSGGVHQFVYDGTNMVLQDPADVPALENIPITSAITVVPSAVMTGQTKPTFKPYSALNDFEKGNLPASLTSDASSSVFDWRDDLEQWLFSNGFSAITKQFSVELGKKYFIYCKLKDGSVGRIKSIFLRYSDESFQFATSTVEDSLKMSGSIIADKTDFCNFKIGESTAGLMERDYQLFIPVTDLGLDALTDEQLQDLGDAGFFNGIKNYDEIIISNNKNLFVPKLIVNTNLDTLVIGKDRITFGGVSGDLATIEIDTRGINITTLSGTVVNTIGEVRIRAANAETGVYIGNLINGATDEELDVTDCNTLSLTFVRRNTPATWEGYVDNLMLEIGSALTEYVSHQHSTQRISGARLPNGNGDTEIIQVVSDMYLVKEDDITALSVSGTNVDTITVVRPDGGINGTSGIDGRELIEGFLREVAFANIDLVESIGSHYAGSTFYQLIVAKGTYPSAAAAKADLVDTQLIYELLKSLPRTNSELLTVYTDGSINIPYAPYELILEGASDNEAQVRLGNAEAIGSISNRLQSVRNNFIMEVDTWIDDTANDLKPFWYYEISIDCTSDDPPFYAVDPTQKKNALAAALTNDIESFTNKVRIYASFQPSKDLIITVGVR